MSTEVIELLLKNNPQLQDERAKLERLTPGNYCIHRSWGFGEIRDYDATQNRILIDFEEDRSGHAMAPEFCVDKLEILDANHILVKKAKDPERIESLIKKQDPELIVEILSIAPDRSASTLELETLLLRLLGSRYRRWWTAMKKKLVKDPRIAVPSKKTDPFVLRIDPINEEEELLEEFYDTNMPRRRVVLADNILQVARTKEELKASLPDVLEILVKLLPETRQLTDAEVLHGLWVRNDIARFLEIDHTGYKPTAAELIEETENLSELAENLPSSFHRRFLEWVKVTSSEDWVSMTLDLLKNSSGKFTGECINFLIDNGHEELVKTTMERWLIEQNLKAPVLFWVAKNRNSKKYANILSNLHDHRMLQAIFFAIDYEALQNTSTKRIPLADLVSDDRELIQDLLASANAETARDLATMLIMNQGFEDLTKKSVLARFIKQFPAIQQLVTGETESSSQEDESLLVSRESFEALRAEYEDLIHKKIPENQEAIAIAREHGDLRENSEYKMARQDQAVLMGRKGQIEQDLALAQITDFSVADTNSVSVGSIVELQLSSGSTTQYAILGAWDSNPENHILSYKTPLAQLLLNKTVGDTVTTEIDGNREEWTITGISRWVDSGKSL